MEALRATRSAMVTALLAALLSPAADARVWEGRGQLEVRVRSSEGGPVSGAEIELLFLERQPPSGPPVETTGPRGRATISGLAGGTWSIRVRHPDHLTYGARLEIDIGRKVDEIQAFHQSEGEGTGILRLDYDKVRRGPPPPPVSTPSEAPGISEPPAPPPPAAEPTARKGSPEDEVPEGREEEAPMEDQARASNVEPPSEETPPGASTEGGPTEEPPSHPAEEVQEKGELGRESDEYVAPTPEPPTEEPEEDRAETSELLPEEAEALEPADSEEAPPTVPVPEEAAPPAVEPSAPTLPRARLRSSSGGSCPDCRPGETALSVDAVAAPGGPDGTCPQDARARAEEAIEGLIPSLGPDSSSFYGPLADPALQNLLSLAPPQRRTATRKALGELLSPESACRLLAVVLPIDAEFTGFRYEARGIEGGGDCLPERECPIGQARWIGVPVRIESGDREVVFGLFLNTSPNRERHPRLTAYFRH